MAEPFSVRGKWRRHWRTGAELVGKGTITLSPDGFVLEARRSTLARSALYLAGCTAGWSILGLSLLALPVLSALVTATGAAKHVEGAWLVPFAGVVVMAATILAGYWAWRGFRQLTLPAVLEPIGWKSIASLTIRPNGLWVVFDTRHGAMAGHFARESPEKLRVLVELARAAHPEIAAREPRDRVLPLWADRGIQLGSVAVALLVIWVYRHVPAGELARWQANAREMVVSEADPAQGRRDLLRSRAAAWLHDHPIAWNGTASADENGRRFQAAFAALARDMRAPDDADVLVDVFLARIDFEEILRTRSFANDLDQFHTLHDALDDAAPGADAGDGFIVRLGEAFLTYPITDDTLDAKIRIAKKWLDAGGEGGDAFTLVGRFLLAKVANRIEEEVRSGKMSHADAKKFESQLSALGTPLDLPVGRVAKLLQNLASGKSGYVASRLGLSALSGSGEEGVRLAQHATYSFDEKKTIEGAVSTGWFESRLFQSGGEIGSVSVATELGPPVRFAWIERRHAPLTLENIGAMFPGKMPRLVTGASYIDARGRTSGFSATYGVVTNYAPSARMDGLVVVHGGRITVHDLRKGVILPGERDELDVVGDLSDYESFVRWVQRERASCFQTHLLAIDDDLAIDPSRAKETPRERRLLVLLEKGSSSRTAIMDLPNKPTPRSLAEAATIGLTAFKQAKWTVRAIANLDVGSYNILVVTRRNRPVNLGAVRPETAENLLVGFQ